MVTRPTSGAQRVAILRELAFYPLFVRKPIPDVYFAKFIIMPTKWWILKLVSIYYKLYAACYGWTELCFIYCYLSGVRALLDPTKWTRLHSKCYNRNICITPNRHNFLELLHSNNGYRLYGLYILKYMRSGSLWISTNHFPLKFYGVGGWAAA